MQSTVEPYRRHGTMDSVYLVASDMAIRDSLETLLGSFGVPIEAYTDSTSFLRAVGCAQRGVLIVEAEQPNITGFDLLQIVREQGSDIPFLMMVDKAQCELAQRARQAGASGVLEIPFDNDDVISELQRYRGINWPQLALTKTQVSRLENGHIITVRPMQPGDRDIEQALVRNLSPMSRARRFFGGLKELSDNMLDEFTHIHYPDNVALIATVSADNFEEQIGVARYAVTDEETAEFAIAVADEWQGQGVGTLLLHRLLECARSTQIHRIVGSAYRENRGVQCLARETGFDVSVDPADDSFVILRKSIA